MKGSQAKKVSTRGIRMRRVVTSKHKRKKDVLLINPHESSPSCHAVFAFLNPLLVGILEVHSQGSKLSPFATHEANLWVFLWATFIYCFAVFYYKSYPKLAGSVALITGSLGSVSILSIFLPHLLGQLSFVIWIFLPMYIARSLIVNVGQRVLQASKTALCNVTGNFNRVIRSNITEQSRRCCV